MTYDPWDHLPDGVQVLRVRLDHVPACTDGTTIWLDASLTPTEERCALTHELVHVERGDTGPQPPAIEWRVRAETARRLIPNLGDVPPWTPLPELAWDHGVTIDVVLDRIRLDHQEHRPCP